MCSYEAQALSQVPESLVVSQSSCCFLSQEIAQEIRDNKPELCCKGLGNPRKVAKCQSIVFLSLATKKSDVQRLTGKINEKS